jgi:hypothetical protein
MLAHLRQITGLIMLLKQKYEKYQFPINKWIINWLNDYFINFSNKPNPWNTVITGNLIVIQQMQKMTTFIKPEGSYPCRQIPPLFPILCHVNIIHILEPRFHLRLLLRSSIFSVDFQTKILSVFLVSPVRVTCHAQLVLFDFINPAEFGEQNTLWSNMLLFPAPVSSPP